MDYILFQRYEYSPAVPQDELLKIDVRLTLSNICELLNVIASK